MSPYLGPFLRRRVHRNRLSERKMYHFSVSAYIVHTYEAHALIHTYIHTDTIEYRNPQQIVYEGQAVFFLPYERNPIGRGFFAASF